VASEEAGSSVQQIAICLSTSCARQSRRAELSNPAGPGPRTDLVLLPTLNFRLEICCVQSFVSSILDLGRLVPNHGPRQM
jgi:hypothetical protein